MEIRQDVLGHSIRDPRLLRLVDVCRREVKLALALVPVDADETPKKHKSESTESAANSCGRHDGEVQAEEGRGRRGEGGVQSKMVGKRSEGGFSIQVALKSTRWMRRRMFHRAGNIVQSCLTTEGGAGGKSMTDGCPNRGYKVMLADLVW